MNPYFFCKFLQIINVKRLRIIVLLLFAYSPCLGLQHKKVLETTPRFIEAGESVCIRLPAAPPRGSRLSVLSPSGKKHDLPLAIENGISQISFKDTYCKGFLDFDWNRYDVSLTNSKNEVIDSAQFFLKEKNKTLYFTVYVDDIGGGGYLNTYSERWFKQLGGKINYGFENDEWGFASLKAVISKYDDKGDFIFYHFHPLEFKKNGLFLRINHLLNWKSLKEYSNRLLGIRLRDRHYFLLCFLLFVVSLGFIFYKGHKLVRVICLCCIAFSGFIFAAIGSSQLVLNQANWNLKFADPDWCKRLLLDAKREFSKFHLQFPQIVRHGFNIPPRGLNEFYITQMGVLADASLVFLDSIRPKNGKNKSPERISGTYVDNNRVILQQLGRYSYSWPKEIAMPLPFYTQITGEVDTPYQHGEPSDMGLLEIPLTFDNICENGSYEVKFEILDSLPNGALISTYVHPKDDLRYLDGVLTYLKDRYELVFVNALEYLNIYMRHYPRPIFIDTSQKKAYWAAYLKRGIFPLMETDIVEFHNGKIAFRSDVLPPMLGIKDDLFDKEEFIKEFDYVETNCQDILIFRLKGRGNARRGF